MEQPGVKAPGTANIRTFLPLNKSEVETGPGPSSPMTDSVQLGMQSPTAIVISNTPNHKEIQQTEKKLLLEIRQMKLDIGGRVGILEKYKWLVLGGSIVIGWILSSNFKTIIEMMN